jgi:hypothetical protein
MIYTIIAIILCAGYIYVGALISDTIYAKFGYLKTDFRTIKRRRRWPLSIISILLWPFFGTLIVLHVCFIALTEDCRNTLRHQIINAPVFYLLFGIHMLILWEYPYEL